MELKLLVLRPSVKDVRAILAHFDKPPILLSAGIHFWVGQHVPKMCGHPLWMAPKPTSTNIPCLLFSKLLGILALFCLNYMPGYVRPGGGFLVNYDL